MFGESADAVVLEAGENLGVMSTHLQAEADSEALLHVKESTADGYIKAAAGPAKVRTEGREAFKLAVQRLTATARETLAKHGLD